MVGVDYFSNAGPIAFVVKATVPDARAPGKRQTTLYAVLTNSPLDAMLHVKGVAEEGARIECTEGRLSPVTTKAIGLMPHYAVAL